MITTNGITQMTNAIKPLFALGAYTIGGVTKDITLDSITITGSTITAQYYLDDNVVGTITNFKIKAPDGNVIIDKLDTTVKALNKGLLIRIAINISEVI